MLGAAGPRIGQYSALQRTLSGKPAGRRTDSAQSEKPDEQSSETTLDTIEPFVDEVPQTPLVGGGSRREGFDSLSSGISLRRIGSGLGFDEDVPDGDENESLNSSHPLNSSISIFGPDKMQWTEEDILEPIGSLDSSAVFREFSSGQSKVLAGIAWQLRILGQLFASTAQQSYLSAVTDLLQLVEPFALQRGMQQRAEIAKSLESLHRRLITSVATGHVNRCALDLVSRICANWSDIFSSADSQARDLDDTMAIVESVLEGLAPLLIDSNDQAGGKELFDALHNCIKNGYGPELPDLISDLDRLNARLEQVPESTDKTSVPIKYVRAHIWFAKQVFAMLSAQSNEHPVPEDEIQPADQSAKAQFVHILEAVRIPYQGNDDEATDELSSLIDYLKDPITDESTDGLIDEFADADSLEKQWAIASLRLENILKILQQRPADKAWKGVKLAFIQQNITNLIQVAGARWAEQAHAQVLEKLPAYFRHLWSFAYTSSDKGTLFGGISLNGLVPGMPELVNTPSARVGISHTRATMVDDEIFPAKKITSGAFGVAEAGLAIATIDGKASYEQGTYEEWDNPKQYVLGNLSQLVSRLDQCKPHLNRYASAGIAPPRFGLRRDDLFQLKRHDEQRKNFNLHKENISQTFSTLLSIVGKDLRSVNSDDQTDRTSPAIQVAPANDPSRPVNIAPIQTEIGTSALFQLNSTAGAVSASLGCQYPVIAIHGGGTITQSRSKLNIIRTTSICAKLKALELEQAEYNGVSEDMDDENSPAEKIANIHHQIDQQSRHFVTNMRASQQRLDCVATRATAFEMLDRQTHPAIRLREIQKYFAEYTRFQVAYERAKSASEKTTITAMINGFHTMFGATDRERFLYALVLLNADLYIQTQTDDKTGLREAIISFENQLINPTFTVDKKALDQLATYGRKLDLKTDEIKMTASFTAGIAHWTSIAKLSKVQLGVSLTISERQHPKSLRMATNYDIEIQLPRWRILGTKEELANSIVQALSGSAAAREIPDLWETVYSSLDCAFDVGEERVVTMRWTKPALFRVGCLPMYSREVISSNQSLTPSFGLGGGATAGVGYEAVRNEFSREVFSGKAIWYSLIRFAHDQGQKWITRNGDQLTFDRNGYWSEIVRYHRPEFEELFLNAAKHKLDIELNGLEDAFNALPLTDHQRRELVSVRNDFEDAAEFYAHNTDSYAACLECYQRMLYVYSTFAAKITAKSQLFTEVDQHYTLQPAWQLPPPRATIAMALKDLGRRLSRPRNQVPSQLPALHNADTRLRRNRV